MSGDDNLSIEDGKIVARIKASVDVAEAGRINERVKRIAKQGSERGLSYGGRTSFAYRVDPSTMLLVLSPDQVVILNKAADQLLKRHTCKHSVSTRTIAGCARRRMRFGAPGRSTTRCSQRWS